jgi:2',3'-cyclic-nucleotide 2'-phosphodiesterase (5'-nucleotidase family)
LTTKNKVLAANIDTTGEPRIDGKLPKSTVVTVGGRRIGIIGYVTEETSVRYIRVCASANINKTFLILVAAAATENLIIIINKKMLLLSFSRLSSVECLCYYCTFWQYISSPEGVKIFDEVKGVRDEAERLKQQGVNILIAVGHAGYLKDMEIAEKVPDIDVVVGGHTNTFLWNGRRLWRLASVTDSNGTHFLPCLCDQVLHHLSKSHKDLIQLW